jgi:ABC-type metal ion transport system substrate-binding protein
MEILRLAYRDHDRTPVIYCIREMAPKDYGIAVRVLQIKDYEQFESAIFNDSADVLIDHVEFLEKLNGKNITFFCACGISTGEKSLTARVSSVACQRILQAQQRQADLTG